MTGQEIRQREIALSKSRGMCEVCCKPLGPHAQAAHRIGNTKANRAKYGDFIIDHPDNVGYTCSLECNGKLDISKSPCACIRLCAVIYTREARYKQLEASYKQNEASGKQEKATGSNKQP